MTVMHSMLRIRGAMQVLQTTIDGTKGDDTRWNLAWRDAIKRIKVADVMKCCKEVHFDGNDGEKREAAIVARLLKRGFEFAKQVAEVEHDVANIYPADLAQKRLDEELGWEVRPNDTLVHKLDRSCMIARVRNPDTKAVRANAHAIIRGRFNDLELTGDAA
jgi:hypothetical protein